MKGQPLTAEARDFLKPVFNDFVFRISTGLSAFVATSKSSKQIEAGNFTMTPRLVKLFQTALEVMDNVKDGVTGIVPNRHFVHRDIGKEIARSRKLKHDKVVDKKRKGDASDDDDDDDDEDDDDEDDEDDNEDDDDEGSKKPDQVTATVDA